jgi:hypothetical protein
VRTTPARSFHLDGCIYGTLSRSAVEPVLGSLLRGFIEGRRSAAVIIAGHSPTPDGDVHAVLRALELQWQLLAPALSNVKLLATLSSFCTAGSVDLLGSTENPRELPAAITAGIDQLQALLEQHARKRPPGSCLLLVLHRRLAAEHSSAGKQASLVIAIATHQAAHSSRVPSAAQDALLALDRVVGALVCPCKNLRGAACASAPAEMPLRRHLFDGSQLAPMTTRAPRRAASFCLAPKTMSSVAPALLSARATSRQAVAAALHSLGCTWRSGSDSCICQDPARLACPGGVGRQCLPPFRCSPLTRALEPLLRGGSQLLLLTHVGQGTLGDTLTALRLATRFRALNALRPRHDIERTDDTALADGEEALFRGPFAAPAASEPLSVTSDIAAASVASCLDTDVPTISARLFPDGHVAGGADLLATGGMPEAQAVEAASAVVADLDGLPSSRLPPFRPPRSTVTPAAECPVCHPSCSDQARFPRSSAPLCARGTASRLDFRLGAVAGALPHACRSDAHHVAAACDVLAAGVLKAALLPVYPESPPAVMIGAGCSPVTALEPLSADRAAEVLNALSEMARERLQLRCAADTGDGSQLMAAVRVCVQEAGLRFPCLCVTAATSEAGSCAGCAYGSVRSAYIPFTSSAHLLLRSASLRTVRQRAVWRSLARRSVCLSSEPRAFAPALLAGEGDAGWLVQALTLCQLLHLISAVPAGFLA